MPVNRQGSNETAPWPSYDILSSFSDKNSSSDALSILCSFNTIIRATTWRTKMKKFYFLPFGYFWFLLTRRNSYVDHNWFAKETVLLHVQAEHGEDYGANLQDCPYQPDFQQQLTFSDCSNEEHKRADSNCDAQGRGGWKDSLMRNVMNRHVLKCL